jgi:hypothetical protein
MIVHNASSSSGLAMACLLARPAHRKVHAILLEALTLPDNRIWQTVPLTGGDQIVLDVFVWSYGWTVGSAGMSISNGQSTWSSSLEVDSSWGVNTGWQQLTLTVPASGTYELTLLSALDGDAGAFACFDNIRVIPAPGAAALLGLSSVLVARRRRRSEEHSPMRCQI